MYIRACRRPWWGVKQHDQPRRPERNAVRSIPAPSSEVKRARWSPGGSLPGYAVDWAFTADLYVRIAESLERKMGDAARHDPIAA